MDHDQAAVARRTCASLRERVAARVLDRGLPLPAGTGEPSPKDDGLSPATLRDDPSAFYRALTAEVTVAGLGPADEPSPLSPASRLVDTCRDLGS